MTAQSALVYGCRLLPYDPQTHAAAFGARLIYREVLAGSTGIVSDRKDVIDPDELFGQLTPPLNEHFDTWLDQVRQVALPGSSDAEVRHEPGPVVIVGSPQGSHGYLYVTAAIPHQG